MNRLTLPRPLAASIFCAALIALPVSAYADEGETDPTPAEVISERVAAPDTANNDNQNDSDSNKAKTATADKPQSTKPKQSTSAEQTVTRPDAEESTGENTSDQTAAPAPEEEQAMPAPFAMLGSEVPAGETRRLSWVASESFSGISVPTPVLVSHGTKAGPTLCLTAAVHGDELNGIEMVRRVLYGLDPSKLSGTVIGVPIVNLFGFRRSSRYLPDRRDLNRYFPGDPRGSSASRIAYAFFESVVRHCDYLVDLHTGSFHRTNLPQLRADLSDPAVLKLTQGFGATAVLRNTGQVGTLRRAATDAGIPAVTLEAGEPTRFQPEEVAHGVKGIRTLLNKLGMLKRVSLWGDPQPVYYASDWIRADTGGILFSRVSLGDEVEKGQILGTVTDPITNNRSEITAPVNGHILGMALNQVVIPGFASFRIGIQKSSEEVVEQASVPEISDDAEPVEAPVSKDDSTTEQEPQTTQGQAQQPAQSASDTQASQTKSINAGDRPAPPASKDGVDEERPD